MSEIKRDGTKYTRADHIYYTNYIATRDGAIFAEGMEHGLFGKYGAMEEMADIENLREAAIYVGDMFDSGKEVYRCAISLTEKEAAKLGYLEREKWMTLLDTKMFDIADEYNIKFADVEFVGSVHMEPEHPHLQFNFWDKNQTIRNKILPKPQFERRMEHIRAILSKEIYKESIHEILQGKEAAEKSALTGFNAFLRGISEQEVSAAELDLKGIFPELCDEKMLDIKVDDRYINEVWERMNRAAQSIRKEYPKGALKYKYLPRECKNALDDLTATVLQHPDFRRELNRYLRSVKEYSTALGNSTKTIAEEQHKALKEMNKRFGNRILNNLREAIRGEEKSFGPRAAPEIEHIGGVDIVVEELPPASIATIFDYPLLQICNKKGVFHEEDLEDNASLTGRVRKLEELGHVTHFGMRYEVTPEFKSQVEDAVADFKKNRLWGIDRHFVELKQFTLEDLKAHPKNENKKMERRLPLLLAAGLLQVTDDGYLVTEEYKQCYKAQLEDYRQSQFQKWFEENIDTDVTISVFDAELVRMAHDGILTREDLENHERGSKMEFRLRRLVAENYVLNNGDTFTLTEKFRDEVGAKLEDFKQNLYAADKAIVKMECFTLSDVKENAANKKKKEGDELGAMEKRLPVLLAAGLVVEMDGEYTVSDEYRNACYTSSAAYRQKTFEQRVKPQEAAVKTNLFDSEFLAIAKDNRFTQAEVERHSECGRLDWRLRTLITAGFITAEGTNYTLTDAFLHKLRFTQKQFERSFKVGYKDLAFLRRFDGRAFTKEQLEAQPDKDYLKWRIYGLCYKGLFNFDGTAYTATEEFRDKAAAAEQAYYKAFSVRLFDKEFESLGESFSLVDVSKHPMGAMLTERMDALQHKGLLTDAGNERFSMTPQFRNDVDACFCKFKAIASDGALLKLLNKNELPQSALDKSFRADALTMRLQEYVIREYVTKTERGYLFSEKAVDLIKKAVDENIGEFKLRYFDSNFCLMGDSFTIEDIENHAEGLFLIDRLGTLVGKQYITNSGEHYSVTTELSDATQQLADSVEPSPFDMDLLRLADENNVIEQSTLAELENPFRMEYRLQDMICKGFAVHAEEQYLLDDEFVEAVTAAYEDFKAHFMVQPYDGRFAALGTGGTFQDHDLDLVDKFFQKRLSSLLLADYVVKDGDNYVVTEELEEAVRNAQKDFSVNHFDYDLVRGAGEGGVLSTEAVLSGANGEYLQKRLYSLEAIGLVTVKDGMFTLSDELIQKAKLVYEDFAEHFQISSYDLHFLELNGTAEFTEEELKKDSDFSYLSSRLRSLVQLGLVTPVGKESYQMSGNLIEGAQKALEEFEVRYSDIRFLRVNGTTEFTEDEIDFSLGRRLRELIQQNCIVPTDEGYRMTDEFMESAQETYDKVKKEFRIQPYDSFFTAWAKDDRFQLEALGGNTFFEGRLYMLSLLEYIQKDGDNYVVSDELRNKIAEAEKDFAVNHFDYDIVKLAEENSTLLLEKVLSSRDGAYLEKRFYSLLAMGQITEQDGVFTLTDSLCSKAELIFKEFKENFKISSYDLRFFQLTTSLDFSDDDLQRDTDCDYLSNRLRSLIQLGFVQSCGQGDYRISDKLMEGAQKASLEFDVTYSDIRFLRVNGTPELTEDEIDFLLGRRLRELIQHNCIVLTDEGYRMTDEFMESAQKTYDTFREDFSIQPYDGYFTAWAKDDMFQLEDLRGNQFFEGRLYSLLLLEYVKKDGDNYVVTEELKEAVKNAQKDFSVNHFDVELVKLADVHGNLTVANVMNDVNGDYLEKRMYSLIAAGYITQQGDRLHLSELFINLAKNSSHEYRELFKVSCYDVEFLKIGTAEGFTKEQLKEHKDCGFLESRLRSLVQVGYIRFDGKDYHINPILRPVAETAFEALSVKSADNRFLQINGTNTFTQKEADQHYELGSRLRELCMAGWITKNKNSYTVSQPMVKQIRFQLDQFAETKIGTWDKPFLTLHEKLGGFTLEELKKAYPMQYETLSRRLEYLHVNDLFEKVGKRYFAKQALVNGIDRAEKVQQGIRRQTAVLLLMDVFKMFSKLTNQQNMRREQDSPHNDLSLEAKKDIMAEQSSTSGLQWEDYER